MDPHDLSQRARWTIIATACLLLLMCLMLIGVTLRMAPIIDDMGECERNCTPEYYQLLFGLRNMLPKNVLCVPACQAVLFNLKSVCNSSGTSSVWISFKICLYI